MTTEVHLSISLTTHDPEMVARVSENFARTAAGLALEGAHCIVSIGPEPSLAELLDSTNDDTL